MNTAKLIILRGLNAFVRLFLGYQLGQKLPLLKKIYNFSYNFFRPSKIKVFDQWLILHPEDQVFSKYILAQNVFEEIETQLFIKSLSEGAIVLDIGANVGYYTLIAAQKVGLTGHVYAFEPDHENFKILEKNINLNRHSNVTPIQSAVSDKDGYLELYLSPDNKGDHKTYKDSSDPEERTCYKVKAISLDNFFLPANICPSVIKIDIQGFEFFALAGMKTIITKTTDLILYTEFWPYGLVSSGLDSPIRYYEELEQLGFKMFNINEFTKSLSKVNNVYELLESIPEGSFTNLLCVKGNLSKIEECLIADLQTETD